MPGHHCKRGQRCVDDYVGRLSGPFMDRIDMHVNVNAVMASDLVGKAAQAESSDKIRDRVLDARDRQSIRFEAEGLPTSTTNATAPFQTLQEAITIVDDAERLLADAADKFQLSARAFTRILRLATTLSDLDHSDAITRYHVAEAIGYRIPNAFV